jgi:hypothetical protein
VTPAIPSAVLYRLDRARNTAAVWISHAAEVAAFVGFVLIAGMGSSWYAIEIGSPFTTVRQGPWVSWSNAASRDVDPYTRSHFARSGSLPFSAIVAATFEAKHDTAGDRLHSSCDYVIEGRPLAASWWSVGVFDDRGLLIPNAADRYGFTSDTVAPNPDGGFFLSMSRDARPGNWLPVGGAGRLTLQLTMIEPVRPGGAQGAQSRRVASVLPTIRKTACR